MLLEFFHGPTCSPSMLWLLSHVIGHVLALRSLQIALVIVLQVFGQDPCSELRSIRGVSHVVKALFILRGGALGSDVSFSMLSFYWHSSEQLTLVPLLRTRSPLSGGPADLWSTYPVCNVPLSYGGRTVGTTRRDMSCRGWSEQVCCRGRRDSSVL